MRFVAHLWPILFLACVDRTLDDTAAGASTGATGSATATTPSSASDTTPGTTASPTTGPSTTGPSTSGPSTSGPSTTGPVTTGPSTTTTGPVTTGPSSTVTTEVSTTIDPSETTSDPPDTTGPMKLDMPNYMEKPPGLVGCTLAAPPTAVKGKTPLGQFSADRAYFGAVDINGILIQPHLMLLSPGADPLTEFAEHSGNTGPIVEDWDFTDVYDLWLGPWETVSDVIAKNMFANVAVTITITELAGNWDAPDPNDPPRLLGSFAGDLSGPFEAIYCDKLDINIIAE